MSTDTSSTSSTTTAPENGGGRRRLFRGANLRQFGILGSLIVIILLFQFLTGGLTLDPINLINVVNQYSYILILAIGMVMVIIAGHIDLSVGSVAAFTGIVVAKSMADWHISWPLAIVVGLVVGALIGAWQGFWVAYVGVPAFIVTLAGMLIFRGGNQFIGQSTSVPVPQGFTFIGAGYIPDFGPFPFSAGTMILGILGALWILYSEWNRRRVQKKMGSELSPLWVSVVRAVFLAGVILWAAWLFANGRPGTSFPISGIILVVLVILYSFITRNTIGGRHIYAVGGNRLAATLSGVKDRKVDFFVMMNMSMLAAVAGMIYVARSTASGPQDGNGWELDAIAAVFIGGAAVSGGIGTVIGSIVGGLVMAFLNNGLQLIGTGADVVQIIKGLVLLLAVGVDVWSKSQGRPSILGLWSGKRKARLETPAAEEAPMVVPDSDNATAQPADLTRN